MNTIYVKGNITRDVEVKPLDGGMVIAKFGVADNYKNKRGDETVTFYNVTAFGRTAEGCGKLRKGDRVMVEGRFSAREYDATDGTKKMSLDIAANDVAVNVAVKAAAGAPQGETMEPVALDDSGIPF